MNLNDKDTRIDRAAARLGTALLSLQRRICNRVNRWLARLSAFQVRLLFLSVLLAALVYSGWLISSHLLHAPHPVHLVQPIRIPQLPEPEHQPKAAADSSLLLEIERYEQLMDSLHQPIPEGMKDTLDAFKQSFYE